MKPVVFFLLMLGSVPAFSQDSSLITVKSGEDIGVLYGYVYRYPQFLPGKVFYLDGDSAGGLINYNLFEQQIHFIEKDDTMQLGNTGSVGYVTAAGDSFYYSGDLCLRLAASYGFAKLLVRERLRLHDEHRIGALGMPRPTHNIDSKSSFNSWQTLKLQLNRTLVFSRESQFYFLDDAGVHPANRKNLSKLFRFGGDEFSNYLETHDPDLKDEKELTQLFIYMQSVFKKRGG